MLDFLAAHVGMLTHIYSAGSFLDLACSFLFLVHTAPWSESVQFSLLYICQGLHLHLWNQRSV